MITMLQIRAAGWLHSARHNSCSLQSVRLFMMMDMACSMTIQSQGCVHMQQEEMQGPAMWLSGCGV
jgi:hypothetical protein